MEYKFAQCVHSIWHSTTIVVFSVANAEMRSPYLTRTESFAAFEWLRLCVSVEWSCRCFWFCCYVRSLFLFGPVQCSTAHCRICFDAKILDHIILYGYITNFERTSFDGQFKNIYMNYRREQNETVQRIETLSMQFEIITIWWGTLDARQAFQHGYW